MQTSSAAAAGALARPRPHLSSRLCHGGGGVVLGPPFAFIKFRYGKTCCSARAWPDPVRICPDSDQDDRTRLPLDLNFRRSARNPYGLTRWFFFFPVPDTTPLTEIRNKKNAMILLSRQFNRNALVGIALMARIRFESSSNARKIIATIIFSLPTSVRTVTF